MTRPDFDHYFMEMARTASLRATCLRGSVGAVIVSPERQILATGYNSAPRGMAHCTDIGCLLVEIGGRQSCLRTVHAEENAIVQAARHGVRVHGATLYTTASPCYDCFKMLINAGIERVVYLSEYSSARSFNQDIPTLAKQAGVVMEKLS